MGKFVAVARAVDLPPGKSLSVEVGPRTVAVFNLGGKFFALDDTCTHSGGPISEGQIDGRRVVCPWHGAEFDVESGASCSPIAPRNLRSYVTRERDGAVEVEEPDVQA